MSGGVGTLGRSVGVPGVDPPVQLRVRGAGEGGGGGLGMESGGDSGRSLAGCGSGSKRDHRGARVGLIDAEQLVTIDTLYTMDDIPQTRLDYLETKTLPDLQHMLKKFLIQTFVTAVATTDFIDPLIEWLGDNSQTWIVTYETSPENDNPHYHLIFSSVRRSDNIRRTLAQALPNVGCFKIEKVKYLPSILRYITKDCINIWSNDLDLLECAAVAMRSPQAQWQDSTDQNPITRDILHVMATYHALSLQEMMQKAPAIMSKHLHKPSLQSIISNCRLFYISNSKKLTLLADLPPGVPDPARINTFLTFQGIDPLEFAKNFALWATMKSSKRNTLVLHGRSNTGKTSFIRPLLALYNYAEAHNENTFSFSGCSGKDIIVWEEPLITQNNIDLCKLVFEGTPADLPHKYRDPIKTTRTPVLITTNRDLYHFVTTEKDAILNRCFTYRFGTTIPSELLAAETTAVGDDSHINSESNKHSSTSCRLARVRPCTSKQDSARSSNSGRSSREHSSENDIVPAGGSGHNIDSVTTIWTGDIARWSDNNGRGGSFSQQDFSYSESAGSTSHLSTSADNWRIPEYGSISTTGCGESDDNRQRLDSTGPGGTAGGPGLERGGTYELGRYGRANSTSPPKLTSSPPKLLCKLNRSDQPEVETTSGLGRAITTSDWVNYLYYIRTVWE
uniref:VP1 protein n=1 Tax=Pleurosicya ichthamaparvovirus TaxID=3156507 RepID=A0AAU7BB82_9VIRU